MTISLVASLFINRIDKLKWFSQRWSQWFKTVHVLTQFATAEDVQMQVVDALATVLTVVDDQSETRLKTLLFGALSGHNHEMSQKLLRVGKVITVKTPRKKQLLRPAYLFIGVLSK